MNKIFAVIAVIAVMAMVTGTAMAATTYGTEVVGTMFAGEAGNDGSLIVSLGVEVDRAPTPTEDPRWNQGYKAYMYIVANLAGDSTQYVFPLSRVGVTNGVTIGYNPGATVDNPGDVPLFKSVIVSNTQINTNSGWTANWLEPVIILTGDTVRTLPDLDGTVYLVVEPTDMTTIDLRDPDALVRAVQFEIRGGVPQFESLPE